MQLIVFGCKASSVYRSQIQAVQPFCGLQPVRIWQKLRTTPATKFAVEFDTPCCITATIFNCVIARFGIRRC